MAATFMFEPDRYLTDFIDNRPGDPKQFDRARLRPIPIFHGTPNFPIIFVEILNSSPIQKSMAATVMFEPGWNLIDFIDKRPTDPTQFDPARLRLNSHFLWNAKLPYNHCWDTIFFSILNLHGGYIYVWTGLIPDWFHWQASREPKTIRYSPAQTHSHFLWNAKRPYNHCWNTIKYSSPF